jgi:hypothetical protein
LRQVERLPCCLRRRHTWRDTLEILGFVVVFVAVAATAVSDKGLNQLSGRESPGTTVCSTGESADREELIVTTPDTYIVTPELAPMADATKVSSLILDGTEKLKAPIPHRWQAEPPKSGSAAVGGLCLLAFALSGTRNERLKGPSS